MSLSGQRGAIEDYGEKYAGGEHGHHRAFRHGIRTAEAGSGGLYLEIEVRRPHVKVAR